MNPTNFTANGITKSYQAKCPIWYVYLFTAPKPGEVYRVDLGMGGKVRMMMVVSREDAAAPRALSICAPITTANRGSAYEVELPSRPFLRERSYANIPGLQAIQHHELQGPIGIFHGKVMEQIREAIAYTFDINPHGEQDTPPNRP